MPGQPPRQIFMRRYLDEILEAEMLLRVVVEETNAEMVVVYPLQDIEVQEI